MTAIAEPPEPTPARIGQTNCDGCHGLGGNWDCNGENEDRDDCNCSNCTGNERCPECGE